MPVYDDTLFNPPAPLAKITICNSENGETFSNMPMLIDSDADVTLIPQQSVELLSLHIDPNSRYELMGFDGTKSIAQAVYLELVFLKRVFKGRFLLINQECGILGRDVLNHLSLILDGPNLNWNEHQLSGS